MRNLSSLRESTPEFRLMIATSWLAPQPWRECQESAIRAATASGLDWSRYLHLVDRHRTPALSRAALKRTPGLSLPPEVEQELQRREQACRLRALRLTTALAQTLNDFEQAQIPVISMKGPLLSQDLYGDSGVRQSRDLDLLVPKDQVGRAGERLTALGWRCMRPYSAFTPRQMQACLRHDKHIEYVRSEQGLYLELHWRAGEDSDQQTAALWARSSAGNGPGACRAMHLTDLLLYLCSHGSDHAWCRAKWLGDLARLCTTKAVNWPAVLEAARAVGIEQSLLLSLHLLEALYGVPAPAPELLQGQAPPLFLIGYSAAWLQRDEVSVDPAFTWFGVREIFARSRFQRLLWPERSWRKKAAKAFGYAPVDYELFRIPDRFFWSYVPLRPLLWAWRGTRFLAASAQKLAARSPDRSGKPA